MRRRGWQIWLVAAVGVGAAGLVLGGTARDVDAHGSAHLDANRPVKKNNFDNGVKFNGAYRTGRTHDRPTLVLKLQYEFDPGEWSTFVDVIKRKQNRRDSQVRASGRGPCLLGSDRYRTVAIGFVKKGSGKEHKRRDVSRPRLISCG